MAQRNVLTLLLPSPRIRENIIMHVQADLLTLSGASELKFADAIAVEPMPARRQA
jgi:hypothetical protein